MKHLIVKQLPETLSPNMTYYLDLGSGKYKQYVTDSDAKLGEPLFAEGIYDNALINNVLPNRGLTNEGAPVPSDIIDTSSEPINIDNLRALDPTIPATATTVSALKAAGLKFDESNKLITYNAPSERYTGYNSVTGDVYVQAVVGKIDEIDAKWTQKYPTAIGGRQNLYIGHSFDVSAYASLSTYPDVKKSMFIGMNNAPYFQDGSALIILGSENLYNSGGAEPKSRIIAGRDSIVVGYNNYKGTSDHTNTGINKQRILFASVFGDNNAAFSTGLLNSSTLIGSRNYYKSTGSVIESVVVGRNNGQYDLKDLRYSTIIGINNFNSDARKFSSDLGSIQYVNNSSSTTTVYSNIPWFTPYYVNKIGGPVNINGSTSLPAGAKLVLGNNPIVIGKMNLRGVVDTSVGSIWIGNNNGSYVGNDTTFNGNDLNNIVIGNLNVGRDATSADTKHDVYNNILIGSRINLKGENNKLVIGHHDSYTTNTPHLVPAKDFLMYGDFKEKYLNVNGKLSIDPTLSDASGNAQFTKQVVAKEDGTLGLIDKISGGETTNDGPIVLKDSTEYSTSNEAYKIIGPDINIKGGRWVDVSITMSVKSTVANKNITIGLVPKTTPYNVVKDSYFKITGTAVSVNSVIVGNITNTQSDLPNTGMVGQTGGLQVLGADVYNKITMDGMFYLNTDNTVNVVVKQHTLDPSYTFYIENINVKVE